MLPFISDQFLSRGSKCPFPLASVQTLAMSFSWATSEEEAPHPSANALPVIQDVELVYKLVHGVACFGDGAKVGHEPHIIALLVREQKSWGGGGQGLGLYSQDR